MQASIIKFVNTHSARFVVEELHRMGHSATLLSSGFVSINSLLNEEAAKLIEDQRGSVVVSGPALSSVISKLSGAVIIRKPAIEEAKNTSTKTVKPEVKTGKASATGSKPNSAVVAKPKKPAPKTSKPDATDAVMKTFALETLKKIVEKHICLLCK